MLLSVPNENPCRRYDNSASTRQNSPVPAAAIVPDQRVVWAGRRSSAASDEDDAGDDQGCAGKATGVERFMEQKISQQGGDQETEADERIGL